MQTALTQNLKRLRAHRKLDQVEVAVGIDVARSTIAGIEAGHQEPGRKTLIKLAEFYGVTIDELYSMPIAPGRPQPGDRIKDKDEAALVGFWRDLDEAGKRLFLLALIRGDRS